MSKRESYIEKTIEFLIPTGNYQNVRVAAKIGETIEWSDAKERRNKIDAIREDLKRQVARDINDVLDSFELQPQSSVKIKDPLMDDEGLDVEEDGEFEL
jgi:hypothetical protein